MKSKLKELFKHFDVIDIEFDSRKVKPFFAFFAIKGNTSDGNEYIDRAIENGAILILTDNLKIAESKKYPNIVYFQNIRAALSIGAGILYPKLPKYLIAITGTNGKTSIALYVQQLIELLGSKSVSIGTLGIIGSDLPKTIFEKEILTTPNPILLRKILNSLAEENIDYVALEASSHGIDQQRLYGLPIQIAAFSSFSQDHLDYHKTLDAYLDVKLRLFKENLEDDKSIIINSDMGNFQLILDRLKGSNKKIIGVGKEGDVKIINILSNTQGQEVIFLYQNKIHNFTTEIVGSFQIYNILIAAFLVKECGFQLDQIVENLNKLHAAPGRLERATTINDHFQIFIDYAHTPDAIEKTLIELRKISKGKLKILFGCGGNRDQSKRKIMGIIAQRFADEVIITDDNPRHEPPDVIRSQIIEGASNAIEIPNREQAIQKTVLNLENGDILLIAGKGHENYQIIGDQKFEFSDLLVVKQTIWKKNDLVK